MKAKRIGLDAFPSPLAGEEGARAKRGKVRGLSPACGRQPPHLPMAGAMGPSLSRKGRGIAHRARLAVAALAAICLSGAAMADPTGRTLRFIPQADLRVLDPIWTTAYITRNHGYMIYDTLFATDERFEVKPQMVESWSVSDDKLRYSFTLREKLRFHDGQPVRSADCIASLKRWMQRDTLGQVMSRSVEAMTAENDRSFAITLKQPFPLLIAALGKLSSNVPFIMPERIAATDGNKQIAEQIGSGPFKFVKEEWEPGHKAVYLRNPDYVPRTEMPSWAAGGKIAGVDRVEWIYIPDPTTALNALLSGEVDWWQQVPTDIVPILEKRSGMTVGALEPIGYIGMLIFNHLQPPFDNPKLRQALLAAIDQGEFMAAAAGDQRFWNACYSYFSCGTPMASEAGAEALKGKRDLARVRQLVKESGYKGERAVVLDATDYGPVHAEALVTADLLKQLGINVDLQAMDWGSVLARRVKRDPVDAGGWNIFFASLAGADAADPSLNFALRGNGEKAWFGWPTNPKLEALRERWIAASDPPLQRQLAAEVQKEAFETVPFVPLGQFAIPTAYRNTLSGVIRSPVLQMWNVEKK
jgi:peptide/nickel transport system substrate-binding protein